MNQAFGGADWEAVIGGSWLNKLGALVLVVPRYSTYAAGVLMLIMAGAIFTLFTNPGEMGPAPAIEAK